MGRPLRAVLACCLAGLLTACSAAAGDGGAQPVDRLPTPGVDADPAAGDGQGTGAGVPAVAAQDLPEAAQDLPEAARTQDHRGATAFVRHWWDQFNVAYASGDATALRAISTQECVFCQSVIDDVEARAAAGERTEGGEISVLDVAAPPDVEAQPAYRVIAVVDQAPGAVRNEAGVEVGGISPTRSGNDFLVVWRDARWLVDGVALTSSQDL